MKNYNKQANHNDKKVSSRHEVANSPHQHNSNSRVHSQTYTSNAYPSSSRDHYTGSSSDSYGYYHQSRHSYSDPQYSSSASSHLERKRPRHESISKDDERSNKRRRVSKTEAYPNLSSTHSQKSTTTDNVSNDQPRSREHYYDNSYDKYTHDAQRINTYSVSQNAKTNYATRDHSGYDYNRKAATDLQEKLNNKYKTLERLKKQGKPIHIEFHSSILSLLVKLKRYREAELHYQQAKRII